MWESKVLWCAVCCLCLIRASIFISLQLNTNSTLHNTSLTPGTNPPHNQGQLSVFLIIWVPTVYNLTYPSLIPVNPWYVERILKVTKNPGNRGRCRKLSLWDWWFVFVLFHSLSSHSLTMVWTWSVKWMIERRMNKAQRTRPWVGLDLDSTVRTL